MNTRDAASALLAAPFALLLLIAACGSPDADGGGEADTATQDTTAAQEPAAPTAPAEPTSAATAVGAPTATDEAAAAAPGGHLVYTNALLGALAGIDPHRLDSGDQVYHVYPAYERLVQLDAEGELIPGLATDWTFDDDGTALELTLREGVTFHDGTPFDAEAVQANIERAKALEDASAEVLNTVALIQSVEVVDDHTARLIFDGPSYGIVYSLSQNTGVMASPAALDGLADTAVGTGPYRMVSFEPEVSVVFERNDDYWGEAPALDEFEIRRYSQPEAALNAVRSGEVDIARIEPGGLEAAEAAGLETLVSDSIGVVILQLNRTRSGLEDVQVRQALAHAIDRELIVDSLSGGLGEETAQMFPPTYFAYNEDYPHDYYEYDPDRARELLAEAGHAGGLSISMLVRTGLEDIQYGEALQQMLGDVGVTVQLETVEPAQWIRYRDGMVDTFPGRWGGRADPYLTMEAQAGPNGFVNPGGGTTPRMTELLEQIIALPEGEERTRLLQEASGESVESVLALPLHTIAKVYAMNPCVEGFVPFHVGPDEFASDLALGSDC